MLNTHDSQGGAAIACIRLIESLTKVDSELNITLLVNEKQSINKNIQQVGYKFNLYLEKLLFFFSEKSKEKRFSFSTNTFGTDIHKNKAIQSADIIHLHWVNQGFLSIKNINNLLKLNKPIFWTFHDMWPFTGGCHHSRKCENYKYVCGNCNEFLKYSGSNDISNQIFLQKFKWENRGKIKVIAVSDWVRNKVLASALFKSNEIHLIPNPINEKSFRPKINIPNRSDNKIQVLIISAKIDNDFKGFEMLVKIANSLEQKHPNKFRLNLVGSISQNSLKMLGISKTCYGAIYNERKIVQMYHNSDVLLSTSPDETFSYTCLEALSCGLPIVAFDTGAIGQFLEFYQNGKLVKEYNEQSFITALEHYPFKDQKKTNPHAISTPFGYEAVGRKMLKAYRLALQE